ncbi:MAG: tetratricopeptide repeat protein, partial [Rhizomicrobium sp.]
MAGPLEILGFEKLSGMDAKTEALTKLNALADNVDEALAIRKSNGLLKRAVKSWKMDRIARAGQLALEATQVCPENSSAYLILGIVLEKMGYLYKSLVSYEEALKLAPDDPEITINLGQLANRLDMKDIAEKLFRRYIELRPDSPMGYNNLAGVFSARNRADDAIELLKVAINRLPEEAVLWNCLATILAEEGRVEESTVFYKEAIRLVPSSTRFYHNLGYAYMHLDMIPEAIALYEDALKNVVDTSERFESKYSRSICLIQNGQVEEGFKEYEIRNNRRFRGYTEYMLKVPLWRGEPLAGKKILVVGEQGLGDEIMFANILPDLSKAVGPDGKLYIAVEPRLVPLFARTYPQALTSHYDDRTLLDKDGNQQLRFFSFIENQPTPDYYAPMGSAISYFRKTVADFPHQPFLTPDAEKTKDFTRALRADGYDGPLVGICWRSMMLTQKRTKYYSSLEDWGPIFSVPGLRFVNLQYGNCEEELVAAEALHGIQIMRPKLNGELHNLTKEIDDNAALSAALDLVISAPTSVAATAAAVGTETWFLLASNGWPQMGTREYPWYAKTRT